MARRRGPPLGFKILASALVLAAILVLGEVGARMLGPELPAWRPTDKPGMLMSGHPTRLWGLAPGVNANGRGLATVDPIGLRAPIPVVPRPSSQARVLVVADSTIFGHGVPDGETLPAQLQAALQAEGLDVTVVNGGIPGYSSAQSRLLLDEVGWALEPSLLVIANLWSDNNFDLWHDKDLLRTAAVFRDNPLSGSALFRLVASSVDRLRGGRGAHLVTWTQVSGKPDGSVRRVPLQDYAENLDAMAREAATRGIGVAFLGLANQDLVKVTYDEGSWDTYFRVQEAVAAHHGAVRVEAQTTLARAVADGVSLDDLFVDELHPSGEGHRRIAVDLAAGLRAAGWPAEPLLATGGPFVVSGLDDPWSEQAEGGYGRDSPQRLLVEDKEADPSAGGEPVQGGAPAGTPLSGAGDWLLEGTVAGAEGPVTIEVSAEGRTLVSGSLPGPGAFTLPIRGAAGPVNVTARTADGREVTQVAEAGSPLSLDTSGG